MNEASAKRCAVCNIPRDYKPKEYKEDKIIEAEETEIVEEDEYIDDENDALFESSNTNNSNNKNKNKNSLKRNDSAVSWGDDEDIDLDNYDGQPILSIDNKDVASRNGNHSNNSVTSSATTNSSTKSVTTPPAPRKKKEATMNGLEYTECWLCTNCFAMNRLLDTLSRYQMKCAFCNGATYTPTTEIIKSFEWDQQQMAPVAQSLPTGTARGGVHTPRTRPNGEASQQATMLAAYEKRKKRRYTIKHINNREGDVLITGMINQNKVTKLSSIDVIPETIVKLCLLFMDKEFNHDAFDTMTNREDFEISSGLTKATRSTKSVGQWRNCFGMKECSMPNIDGEKDSMKFEWVLKCNKRRNKDWEDEPVESVIIGVIEAKGIQPNMGTSFSGYNDGWGLLGDGQKVTDGKYEKFNSGFHHSLEIVVTLQFIKHPWSVKQNKCELLFNNKVAYELNPDKKYRLAVAMNSREYEVEWVGFDKTKEIQQPIEETQQN